MDAATLVRNYKGPFELSHVLCIDSEICLNRHLHVYSFWDVDKGPTRPYRCIKSREFVIRIRDYRTEPLLHYFRVLLQATVHV